jgi:hypothetical protein
MEKLIETISHEIADKVEMKIKIREMLSLNEDTLYEV